MHNIYSSFLFLLVTTTCFSQDGITLQKIDNHNRTTVIANGTKISVMLIDGTKIKGTLADEDAYTMLVNHGGKSSIINYSSIRRITTFKKTDYLSVTSGMIDGVGGGDLDNCGNGCGNGCGNISGPGALCFVAVVAGICVGIVATELIVEGTADMLNDNYYSLDNWQFASVN